MYFFLLLQLEDKTLLDFAQNIISHHGSSIRSRLDNLHGLVVPKGGILDNEGVISMFANGIIVSIFKLFYLFVKLSTQM